MLDADCIQGYMDAVLAAFVENCVDVTGALRVGDPR